jgi:5'-deoxynucleotidase YfbR-like HD superfamily hydrolase
LAATAPELIAGFSPEGPIETALSHQPELLEGLAWGKPRKAHPEGAVGAHVAQLLKLIDDDGEQGERRELLRLIALVHDSFKYSVNDLKPRSGENHHAMRARRFAERYTYDERLLATIELHDRPYAIWRKMKKKGRLDTEALEAMLERIPDYDLFLRFVELDGSSEAKDPEPVRWFRDQLRERGLAAGAVGEH